MLAVPVKLMTSETTAPFAGLLMLRATVQSTKGVGVGPPGVGVLGTGVKSVTGIFPSEDDEFAALAANVMVGTSSGVGSGARFSDVPIGVGDDKGVAKILGVGVGGFQALSGMVGAMVLLT